LPRLLIACWLLVLTALSPAHALEPVTLQLKWNHSFQFAGYYAAQELGYYRDAGLDVTIQPGEPGLDTVRTVLQGKADFGVSNSSLLLARKGGKPVVALAVIFQHSAAVLLASRKAMPDGPSDLIGKRIMIESQLDESLAYLRQLGVPANSITQVPHSLKIDDLISGKVDAISAYRTFEPYFLDKAGFAYTMLSPISVGIDFYGDNLFTTEAQIADHPERVRAFRAASLRGWQYAMAHPEQVADWLVTRYHAPYSRDFYLHEAAAMKPLLRADLIEIGYMNPVRWLHVADTYADLGLLPRDYPLRGFLYQPHTPLNLTWLYIAAAVLAATTAIALYIYSVNRKLARALRDMRHMAQHDSLTGLPNRALFTDRLRAALAAAQRDQQKLALLFIDLDQFKPVNDQHGHASGDLLLQHVADRLQRCVRASDSVARIGGDEFVVLLRTVDNAASAMAIAENICEALRPEFVLGGHSARISASVGVALYPEHGASETELTKHADAAMYVAKERGSDCAVLYQPAPA
jgi:diguanylate cyclase (GGDEF)-like protein